MRSISLAVAGCFLVCSGSLGANHTRPCHGNSKDAAGAPVAGVVIKMRRGPHR
jgi:hypothetical protein